MLEKLRNFGAAKFATIFWFIWKQRNSALWNNSHLDAKNTVLKELDLLYDSIAAKKHKSFSHSSTSQDTASMD